MLMNLPDLHAEEDVDPLAETVSFEELDEFRHSMSALPVVGPSENPVRQPDLRAAQHELREAARHQEATHRADPVPMSTPAPAAPKPAPRSVVHHLQPTPTPTVAAEEASFKQHETLSALDLLISRFEEQSVQTLKHGYINLAIGIAFCATAIVPLLVAVNGAGLASLSAGSIVGMFLPKAIVAVLLLALSCFFLWLYQRALRTNRHYQSEMTSIECLKTALVLDSSTYANSHILELLLEHGQQSLHEASGSAAADLKATPHTPIEAIAEALTDQPGEKPAASSPATAPLTEAAAVAA
jgi:hypothetical protein